MQTEKPQAEGKRIMLETRFTEFPAFSVDQRVGIFGLHQRPMLDFFLPYDITNYYLSFVIFFSFFLTFYVAERPFRTPLGVFRGGV